MQKDSQHLYQGPAIRDLLRPAYDPGAWNQQGAAFCMYEGQKNPVKDAGILVYTKAKETVKTSLFPKPRLIIKIYITNAS